MIDSVSNTYSAFNLNGKNMSYNALENRANRNAYAKEERKLYLQKLAQLKDNLSNQKDLSILTCVLPVCSLVSLLLYKGFSKVPCSDIEKINTLVKDMIKKHKLDTTNFKAVLYEKNVEDLVDVFGQKVANLSGKLKAKGACYILPHNVAFALKKEPLSIFHEVGHAVTGNQKHGYEWHKFTNKLFKYSVLTVFAAPINTVGKDKKSSKQKNLYTFLEKIKKSAPYLGLLMCAPKLAEEFNASKLAISFLASKNKKLVLKALPLFSAAFGTYLFTVLSSFAFTKFLSSKTDSIYLQKSLNKQAKNYQKTLKFDESCAPKIAVIDQFKNNVIKVDWDNKPDMLHGDAVESFIKSGLPNAQISRFDTNLNESSVQSALDEILKSGVAYDAINLSKSSDIKLSNLSKLVGFEVSHQNLLKDKNIIKEKFFNSPYQEAQEIKHIIKSLEKLASQGVKIYVSAGNKGRDYINLYTLADNINVVGAANKYGVAKTQFSCDNPLVNRWCKGVYAVKKLTDKDGNIGFDINEDDKIDILAKDTTSKIKLPAQKIYGTSFAAPTALVMDLRRVIED